MQKHRLISISCAVVVVATAFLVAFYLPSAKDSKTPAAVGVSQQEDYYTLRNYNGKIGVFKNDNIVPDQVLDVYIQSLPESEQQRLYGGITVKGHEALLAILENYLS